MIWAGKEFIKSTWGLIRTLSEDWELGSGMFDQDQDPTLCSRTSLQRTPHPRSLPLHSPVPNAKSERAASVAWSLTLSSKGGGEASDRHFQLVEWGRKHALSLKVGSSPNRRRGSDTR